MDTLDTARPVALDAPAQVRPRVWGFWGTALWGFVVFAAMFIGQIGVVVIFVLDKRGAVDLGSVIQVVAGSGREISLSVIAGLPAVLAALWLAIHFTRTPFADYLALRSSGWWNLLIGAGGLAILVLGWDTLSRATGREVAPDFMVEVLKSARSDGALWLLMVAFCIAAPISEELFARGFLYRGWSQSFLGPVGAILLSSLVWTALHLQYDWFFFGEVFSIGLLLGYLRYRSNSTWLTIILHGLKNLGAVVQTILLTGTN